MKMMKKSVAKLILEGGSLADMYRRFTKEFCDEAWTEMMLNCVTIEARRVLAQGNGKK